MKKTLWKIRVNHHTGSYILQERLKCGKRRVDAASHIGVSPEKLQSYERGMEGIPLRQMASLARFYNSDLGEFVTRMNSGIPSQGDWALADFMRAIVHRFHFRDDSLQRNIRAPKADLGEMHLS